MKIKCKICKYRFKLSKEMLYVAQETACGVSILPTNTKMFDAVDCPRCGCQILLNVREPVVDTKGGSADEIAE